MKITLPQITPGDWHYGELSDSVITIQAQAVCEMPPDNDCEINIANGKAIAALPKLMQACAKALKVLSEIAPGGTSSSLQEALTAAGATIEA